MVETINTIGAWYGIAVAWLIVCGVCLFVALLAWAGVVKFLEGL